MRLERSRFQLRPSRCKVTTLHVVQTHLPLSPNSIIWYQSRATMSCGWEGNRRSGVLLAVRHRLQWFIHLRAQCLSKGYEHPTNAPHGVWYTLYLYMYPTRPHICLLFSEVCLLLSFSSMFAIDNFFSLLCHARSTNSSNQWLNHSN